MTEEALTLHLAGPRGFCAGVARDADPSISSFPRQDTSRLPQAGSALGDSRP